MSDLQIDPDKRYATKGSVLIEYRELKRKYANPDIKAVAGYLYGSHDYKAMKKARQVVSLALDIENK